jgi:hypothetical protein
MTEETPPISRDEVANLLSPQQEASINASLAQFYGSGFDETDPLAEAKKAGLHEMLHADVVFFRREGIRMEPFYVRLTNRSGSQTTACSASKVDRWVNEGWIPVTELEDV